MHIILLETVVICVILLPQVEVFNYVVLSVEAELHNWLLDRGAPSFYYTVLEVLSQRFEMAN